VILVINAAISAGYYLRIVSAIFLGSESPGPRFRQQPATAGPVHHPVPVLVAVGISMVAVLWFGTVWPSTSRLVTRTATAAHIEPAITSSVAQR
jgi:NADH:ubiquinone oxidoreductase subunit 2 (subunit N)